jgi:hypothetical protein
MRLREAARHAGLEDEWGGQTCMIKAYGLIIKRRRGNTPLTEKWYRGGCHAPDWAMRLKRKQEVAGKL